jgi:hypothetical protein
MIDWEAPPAPQPAYTPELMLPAFAAAVDRTGAVASEELCREWAGGPFHPIGEYHGRPYYRWALTGVDAFTVVSMTLVDEWCVVRAGTAARGALLPTQAQCGVCLPRTRPWWQLRPALLCSSADPRVPSVPRLRRCRAGSDVGRRARGRRVSALKEGGETEGAQHIMATSRRCR